MSPEQGFPSTALSEPRGDSTIWSSALHASLARTFLTGACIPQDVDAMRWVGLSAGFRVPSDSTSISQTGLPSDYAHPATSPRSFSLTTWSFDLVDALAPVDCRRCALVPGDRKVTAERSARSKGDFDGGARRLGSADALLERGRDPSRFGGLTAAEEKVW